MAGMELGASCSRTKHSLLHACPPPRCMLKCRLYACSARQCSTSRPARQRFVRPGHCPPQVSLGVCRRLGRSAGRPARQRFVRLGHCPPQPCHAGLTSAASDPATATRPSSAHSLRRPVGQAAASSAVCARRRLAHTRAGRPPRPGAAPHRRPLSRLACCSQCCRCLVPTGHHPRPPQGHSRCCCRMAVPPQRSRTRRRPAAPRPPGPSPQQPGRSCRRRALAAPRRQSRRRCR
eukprot:365415-Chlamydomonas_euryale.AAC.8